MKVYKGYSSVDGDELEVVYSLNIDSREFTLCNSFFLLLHPGNTICVSIIICLLLQRRVLHMMYVCVFILHDERTSVIVLVD